ncbi:flagellar protein FliS [Desulfoluna spongiiphila]|uniref:Flagellin-specific chaperone FliS n=1 Tax=Desulfoluna spongiiphila TaxID=419481 RepID=A0A1G5F0Q8_9BACT|nr:flagellar protein FliS [Desulfoluna spongiiphila]SCY32797.1 Flagellin-specific chaperone FliS [Desulfoluna spongiiphila]VVS94396.1 flagellar protein flis [Desulfoluna spongiiphila]
MPSTHPLHSTPESPSPLGRKELIRMYDDAMGHLAHARGSGPGEQKKSISTVVKILNHLKEAGEKAPPHGEDDTDLSALYAYMIDRLSISHSGLGIDPVNEVNWLIRNLKELSAPAQKPERPADIPQS